MGYYKKPLILTDSGGKDSSVCIHLAKKAGIPFEVTHNHTTADAPETVRFVREQFHELENEGIHCYITPPRYKNKPVSMWTLIPIKLMPPTRIVRYCCDILKEGTIKDSFIVTGVRWAESIKRRKRGIYESPHGEVILSNDNDDKRQLFESCRVKAARVCNPIIDWDNDEVWDYIKDEKITVNPLYCEGWNRVGCIGCPQAQTSGRNRDFQRWPKYMEMYKKAFDKMLQARKERGLQCAWKDREDVFNWWMENDVLSGQMLMFDNMEGGQNV